MRPIGSRERNEQLLFDRITKDPTLIQRATKQELAQTNYDYVNSLRGHTSETAEDVSSKPVCRRVRCSKEKIMMLIFWVMLRSGYGSAQLPATV